MMQNSKLLLICTRHYEFRTLYKAELNINQIRVKDYIIMNKWQKATISESLDDLKPNPHSIQVLVYISIS